ncbi:MAG: hypothetical protein O9288_14255 [Novosphingobium sp.]|uniref:hypothetical protein n=1 Tax=Novosphingobium sp. TaxID=1874826 RepID=UPI0022C69CCB|nr:hypothetical protein [Novosphingobium sp.]MCZ8035910.1 hypothetical protein [Novosphingobium sp.]
MPSHFELGKTYTREQVATAIGMPPDRQGGNWLTGYDKWNSEFFVFCNVGTAGRTGHDYANRWDGKSLIWFGKGGTRLGQATIQEMISGELPVHVFWRGKDRAAFTYAGIAAAADVHDQTPVGVVWDFGSNQPLIEGGTPPTDRQRDWSDFRRGPPPSPGKRTVDFRDSETTLYLMRLEGSCESIMPSLPADHVVLKVGITNSPDRRLGEMNQGFPPGAALGWRLIRQRRFQNGMASFGAESDCLEELRQSGHWVGGEFAAMPRAAFNALVDRHWPEPS